MRVLFLSQLLPFPANAGPKVRIYHVLQHLASSGHEITLVAFGRVDDSAEGAEILRGLCKELITVPLSRSRLRDLWGFVRSTLSGRPFLIERDRSAQMLAAVEALVQRQHFDIVHCDQLWMAQFWEHAGGGTSFTILDQHNAVFMIPKRMAHADSPWIFRWLLNKESQKLRRYERDVVRRFDHTVWVTEQDREAVGIQSGHQTVIPISVDVDSVPHAPRARHPKVVFLGGLHWPPNESGLSWFLDQIWPLVVESVPEASFHVVGKRGRRKFNRVASSVHFHGLVKEPLEILDDAAVFVVPLLAGGGMRVKILDAWRWRLPIVSTTIGAEGIAFENMKNGIVADDPASFAQAVIRLIEEPELARDVMKAGRSTVETLYRWQDSYLAWDQVYARADSEGSSL